MKTTFACPIILSAAFCGMAANAAELPGLSCAQVPDSDEQLCLINTQEAGSEWFVFGGIGLLPRKLLHGPEPAMMQIAGLTLSSRYAAVVSVGEGHPVLDVFDLTAMLEDREAEPVYSLNPYPNVLDSQGWLAPDRLEVTLTPLEDETPEGFPPCPDFKYALKLPEGQLNCRK